MPPHARSSAGSTSPWASKAFSGGGGLHHARNESVHGETDADSGSARGQDTAGTRATGIFALGTPGVLERVLAGSGFVDIEQRTLDVPLRMPSAAEALTMMQEAFGAYRAVVHDSPRAVQAAAWAEVAETLSTFETLTGFVGPAEVLVAAGTRPT